MKIEFALLPDNQIIQLTYADLKRLVLDLQKPAQRWVPVSAFIKKEGKTFEQMRYMREQYPTLFKLNEKKTRWLIDTKEYYKL